MEEDIKSFNLKFREKRIVDNVCQVKILMKIEKESNNLTMTITMNKS